MRVLITGRGVVGTIYGWALSQAGIDVTHIVRRDGLPASNALDLLDRRAGFPRHDHATYVPKTVRQVSPADDFDVVMIATKHYQAAPAVEQYLPGAPHAVFLLFTANWDGTEEIDRLLPRNSMLWGYAEATGGVDARGVLVGTVNPAVRIGMLEGCDARKFEAVTELFGRAGFRVDLKTNIIEWLWVHHAINAGMIGTALWAGGVAEASGSLWALRTGLRATREALSVVAARGVDLEKWPDAKAILNTPMWVAAASMLYFTRFTERGRRLLRRSHFDDSPEEMKHFYFDVLETGERLRVEMPHLSSLREGVESYPANRAAPPAEARRTKSK